VTGVQTCALPISALLALVACNPPPSPARPAPVEAAPAPAAEPPPPPAQIEEAASRKRKAEVAKKVAGQGVLGVIGSQGGGSIADVLGSKSKPAASDESEWPALQGIPVPTTRKFLGAPPA